MIKILDKEVDLWISHTWYNHDITNTSEHGICGHTFEIIEYYYIFKSKCVTKILWPESLTWEDLEIAIRSKYSFDDDEIEDIKINSEFIESPRLLKGSNILLVDGEWERLRHSTILFDNIFMFACGQKDLYKINKQNVTILQDDRIYKKGPFTINYVKKILFDKFKKIENVDDRMFAYLPINCRTLNDEDTTKLIKKYKNILIGTSHPEIYNKYDVDILKMPINNLHEKFNTLIYTPLELKWDCSNRLIPECLFYKKNVEMHLPDDYLEYDTALKYRLIDCKDIENIKLTSSDQIFNIILDKI